MDQVVDERVTNDLCPEDKARIMAELSPIFHFKEDRNGSISITVINNDFSLRHIDDLDIFFLQGGYYYILNSEDNDPDWNRNYPDEEDLVEEVYTDYAIFADQIERILNGLEEEAWEEAEAIIAMLYDDIYNEEDLLEIKIAKGGIF